MPRSRTRNFEALTPDGTPQSTTAENVSAQELPDWRDSSMDLMRGLDVIELPHATPVRPRADSQAAPPREWRQRRRQTR
jgi:hypothetical protein